MATIRATPPPVAENLVGPATRSRPCPHFHRATPRDAMDLARATFLSGARVDMGAMAKRLAVSRATLYRWLSSREQLHEQILAERAREFLTWARGKANGNGLARVLDVFGLVLEATVNAQPVRAFHRARPQLALRILTREHGAVHKINTQKLRAVVDETHRAPDARRIRERIDVAVHVTPRFSG